VDQELVSSRCGAVWPATRRVVRYGLLPAVWCGKTRQQPYGAGRRVNSRKMRESVNSRKMRESVSSRSERYSPVTLPY